MLSTATLRLVTPGKPAHHGARHGYCCSCNDCVIERHSRTAAVCTCERPVLYTDAEGDERCHCGRAARDDDRAEQRAA